MLAKRQRRLPIVAKPAGEACRECPLRRAPCVPTEFNPPSRTKKRVMVIGEAPGRNEADAGKPFIGQSGRATMELLAELGYSREDVVWSNAALCWGKDSEVSKARKACSGRLDREIAEVDPDVILLLGGHALHSVMKTKSKPRIMRWRGTVIRQKTKTKTRLVFPMLHPAFIMRDAAKLYEPLIRMDFDRVDRLMRHGYEPPEKKEGRKIVLAKTVTAIERELATLEKEVAFDVETVGLGATSTRLICLAIADRHKSVVIPFSKSRSGVGKFFNGQHDRALRAINAALANRIAITHNGPAFDHIVAERHGIFIKKWGDTLLGHHTFAAHMPQRLGHLATVYLDVGPWKEQPENSIRDLYRYNGQDSLYTILIWHEMKEEVREQQPVYEQSKRLSLVCKDMSVEGMRFDVAQAKILRRELRRLERRANREAHEILGHEINLLSQPQLRKAFFDELNAPYFFISEKTGQPSLNGETLNAYLSYQDEKMRGLAETVLKLRKARKMRGTYIDAIEVDDDDRVHAVWKNYGAITGRFSCSEPNLMNLTKPQNDPVVHLGGIRSLYIPRDENHTLVAFDFSQLEMRIAAYWSGDPTMMAACEATDMHAANAALIWPDEFRTKEEDKEVYKKLRDMAKQCGFAIAYGAGALTVLGRIIASGITATLQQVEKMLRTMRVKFKVYYAFQEDQLNEIIRTGVIRIPISNRIRVVGHAPKPTECMNTPIQGGAAGLMNMKLLELVDELPHLVPRHSRQPLPKLVAQIHDAAMFDTPKALAGDLRAMIKEVTEKPVELGGHMVRFPTEIKEGPRWSAAA